jgi:hypothetical protein
MGREVVSLRKLVIAAALIVALAVPVAALAATLKNDQGTGGTCGDGQVGLFHFVNNQTNGAGPVPLTVTFSDGTAVVDPVKVNKSVEQWYAESNGTLVTATDSLPGNLVLSDFSCVAVKKKS